MAKYRLANPDGVVALQWQREQMAFLKALAQRHCAASHAWSVSFGDPATLLCPTCQSKGSRDFDRILLLAGRQGGKTRIGTLGAVLEASMPNTYGWVTAPTYRDLTDFVEPAFFSQLPQKWMDEGEWNVSDRLLTLPNGSRVAFRSLEDPQSVRGPTLDWWLMDEACKVSSLAYSVGRAMVSIKRGAIIFTTTPRGEDWVYEDLWCRAEQGVPGHWAARWISTDNPVMDKDAVAHERLTMSPEMFKQEYEADFVTFQGAIYGNALVDPCIVDDGTEAGFNAIKAWVPEWPQINPARPAVVGLDPGSDHPFAGVLAIVTDHGLLIIGEYKKRQLAAMQHAQYLKALVGPLQPRWGIDRSQAQMQIELAQHGIFTTAADNAVEAGIERVKSWMLSGQMRFVKSRTKELVSELRSYRWKDSEKRDGSVAKPEPYKRKDDLADALRYTVMTWPHLPKTPVVSTTQRDLSALPEKDQRDILRMMKHERAEDDKVKDGVGEFYGNTEELESVADSFFE